MSDVPRVQLFLGDAGLRVRQAEDQAVAQALAGPPSAFNFFVHAAGDGGAAAVDAARTPPMLGRVKVVVIREIEAANVATLDALLDYCESPCPSSVLIITGAKTPAASGGVHRGRRLENLVSKAGLLVRYKAEDQDPIAFAVECAQGLGCRLQRSDAQLLVQIVGRDLGRLQNELQKAALYVGGAGTIDGVVLRDACSVVAEADSWQLTDALLRRDMNLALAVTHRLLEEGESTHKLLGMITWQFRQLLTLQDCLRRGVSERDAGVRMPGPKVAAAREQLRRRPLGTSATLDRLARCNRDLNRSRAGDRRIFEGLILDLSAGDL